MAFQYCEGFVRFLRGGYTPKLDDNGFCQLFEEVIADNFEGANIVGDGHFTWAQEHFEGVHVFAPVSLSKGEPEVDEGEGVGRLTKQQNENNKNLRTIRAAVESIFGWAKLNFEQLAKAWQEGDRQQKYMVWIACGVYNFQKD